MNYLLGADPELLLWQGGSVTQAEEVLSDPDYCEEFGVDGSATAVELRPEPSNSPMEIVQTMRGLLLSGYKTLQMEMRAGTGRDGRHPTGGHIHIGVDDLNSKVADFFIGLPLAALEPSSGRTYRRETGYGRWSDLRHQDWGIEYRTPSSWLVSPATARLAMALAWLVGRNQDTLRREVLNGWNGIGWQSESFMFIEDARIALKKLTNLPDYKKIAVLLEPFEFLVDVVGDWSEGRNLVDTWRLDPNAPKPPPPRKEEEAAVRVERPSQPSNIIWNNDEEMRPVRTLCGAVPGEGRLWVVGSRESRGTALQLSPSLFRNRRIRKFLAKHKVEVESWKKFPTKNGEMVVGLPLMKRLDDPARLATIVRLLALNVFNRLEEKQHD